jgi:hypothetical protein
MVAIKRQLLRSLVLLCLGSFTHPVVADFRGGVEARFDYFPDVPLFNRQSSEQSQPSLAAELNWRHSFNRKLRTAVDVFGKYHPRAEDDYFADVREAWLGFDNGSTSLRVGQLMERWGVLEAENIVDIINPRDAVEDFQGDVKLGIPGALWSHSAEQGEVSFWLLPYSRGRRLAEGKDRFRNLPLPIAAPEFEQGNWHPSAALRASWLHSDFELAASHVYGHSRMPGFDLIFDPLGQATQFRPIYDLINQTNIELLWLRGHSLFKLESFYQSGAGDRFFAFGGGVEREIPRLFNSNAALTLYLEAYYDDRKETLSVPLSAFQQDVFVGARLALNDVHSTEFQARVTYDTDYRSAFVDLRAERRINRVWAMETTIYSFLNGEDDPALSGFRDDHRIQIKLIRSF